jgi:hypothetical protein
VKPLFLVFFYVLCTEHRAQLLIYATNVSCKNMYTYRTLVSLLHVSALTVCHHQCCQQLTHRPQICPLHNKLLKSQPRTCARINISCTTPECPQHKNQNTKRDVPLSAVQSANGGSSVFTSILLSSRMHLETQIL